MYEWRSDSGDRRVLSDTRMPRTRTNINPEPKIDPERAASVMDDFSEWKHFATESGIDVVYRMGLRSINYMDARYFYALFAGAVLEKPITLEEENGIQRRLQKMLLQTAQDFAEQVNANVMAALIGIPQSMGQSLEEFVIAEGL